MSQQSCLQWEGHSTNVESVKKKKRRKFFYFFVFAPLNEAEAPQKRGKTK